MLKKPTLVLGASVNETRYSNRAIKMLVKNSIETFAIGRSDGVVAGVPIFSEKKEFKNLDTITLYLSPNNQKDYYDYIQNLNPNRVIFNPGTENQVFASLLEKKGIKTENACTLVLLSTKQY